MDFSDPVALEVFWKLHAGLPQQGPGSDASTRRALDLVPSLPANPSILDLGCGPGRQSLALARETGGHVTAIDALPPFVEELTERAAEAGLMDRIDARQGRMEALDFEEASFDLIWSEGAIYNIGFANGLRLWRPLVRPGGAVAVTEASWLVDEPPAEIRAFWDDAYPAMVSRAENERLASEAGFRLVDSFALPESDWWDAYYTPIEERIERLAQERADPAWQAAIDAERVEVQVVRDCGGTFGYVFFVLERPES